MTRITGGLLGCGCPAGGIAVPKPKTYFEQVPLEVVRKIVEIDIPRTGEKIKATKKDKVGKNNS
jgi:hypothetical protein